MDKNGFSSEPKSVCERIFNAVAKGTSLRTIRRVSDRPEDANLVSAARNAPPENTKAAEVVPLKIDRSVSIESNGGAVLLAVKSSEKSKSATPLENQSQVTETAPKTEPAPITASGKEDKPKPRYKVEMSQSDKFTDYINRAKLKMRATSDVGTTSGKKTPPRADSFNKKVTDYIDRAKFKIRTTSGIGGGKSKSFKQKE